MSLSVNYLDRYVDDCRIKPDLQEKFRRTACNIEIETFLVNDDLILEKVSLSLIGFKAKVFQATNQEKEIINRVIFAVSCRIAGLIPDEKVNLENVPKDRKEGLIENLLDNDCYMDQSLERIKNYSLKHLCFHSGAIYENSLKDSMLVAKKLMLSDAFDLKCFCGRKLKRVNALFSFVNYLMPL